MPFHMYNKINYQCLGYMQSRMRSIWDGVVLINYDRFQRPGAMWKGFGNNEQ